MLKENIDKIHTTQMGIERIQRNLSLNGIDVVSWCQNKILEASDITRNGKNFYVKVAGVIITVNAHSYTIITAHRQK